MGMFDSIASGVKTVSRQAGGSVRAFAPPQSTQSPFETAYDTYLKGAGPDLAALGLNRMGINRNIGYTQQGSALESQALRNNFDAAMGDAQTALGSNAIEIGGQQRLIPYYDQLIGLSDQYLASQMRGFGVDEDQSRLGARKDQAALMSDAVTRGAVVAPGTRQQRGFIDESLFNNLRSIMEGKNQATISNTKQELGYKEQQAQARDRIAQLELEAKNLGMKPAQLRRSLENGLAQLNLHTHMTVDDLMDGLAKNDMQAMSIYNAAIQQGGQYATAYGQIR